MYKITNILLIRLLFKKSKNKKKQMRYTSRINCETNPILQKILTKVRIKFISISLPI